MRIAMGLSGGTEASSPAANVGSVPESGDPEAPGQGSRFRSVGALLPLVLLVMAISAVTAISAGGSGLVLPPVELSGAWRWGVRIAGGLTAAAGILVLVAQRRRGSLQGMGASDPTVGALRTAGTTMGLLTLLALYAAPPTDPEVVEGPGQAPAASEMGADPEAGPGEVRPSPVLPGRGGGARGGRGGGGAGGPGGAFSVLVGVPPPPTLLEGFTGSLPALVLLAIAVVCLVIALRRLRRRREVFPSEVPLAQEEAEALLEASLKEAVSAGDDPRGRVTAAYLRLLAELAASGVPRRAHEAPYEYLLRALAPLGVRAEPLHRLTGLYVLAQFGGQPVTEKHRAAAVEALEASLASLRRVPRPSLLEESDLVQAGPAQETRDRFSIIPVSPDP